MVQGTNARNKTLLFGRLRVVAVEIVMADFGKISPMWCFFSSLTRKKVLCPRGCVEEEEEEEG